MLDEDRSSTTADALARWFQTFQSDVNIDGDQLRCLTSNSNLQDIWQRIIRHCHPTDRVKKVKETLRIAELKERHPDRWEQHKNAQIQQGQMEQRICLRLREISSARSDQSGPLVNELNRVDTMIRDEHRLISSLDNQLEIYRQLSTYLQELSQMKDQLNLFTSTTGTTNQALIAELISTKTSLAGKYQQPINLNDLCSTMSTLIQQRINHLSKLEKEDQERVSTTSDAYEDVLTRTNLDFTKQFVHLGNIHSECAKLRVRLEESKREVLSRRSSSEQTQLASVLDAMICSKSIDVHLNLLKKKIQTEVDQTKRSDEKVLSRVHQQISDKRNELNRIDHQLTKMIQENPLERLDKLEGQIRDYARLLPDLVQRFHSLNIMHLSLANDLRTNLLTWPVEHFSHVQLSAETREMPMDSSPTTLLSNPSSTPTTPLTSLKQLLGIRTQDTTMLESPSMSPIVSKEENERWNTDNKDDEALTIKLPSISSIDWEALTRVDSQMEEALKQCQQDIGQYEQFYQNLIKEIRVLRYESTDKPAFRS